jgi:hypothetical protein
MMNDKELNQVMGMKRVAATYYDGPNRRPNYCKLNELRNMKAAAEKYGGSDHQVKHKKAKNRRRRKRGRERRGKRQRGTRITEREREEGKEGEVQGSQREREKGQESRQNRPLPILTPRVSSKRNAEIAVGRSKAPRRPPAPDLPPLTQRL